MIRNTLRLSWSRYHCALLSLKLRNQSPFRNWKSPLSYSDGGAQRNSQCPRARSETKWIQGTILECKFSVLREWYRKPKSRRCKVKRLKSFTTMVAPKKKKKECN